MVDQAHDQDPENDPSEQPLISHLIELRDRIMRSLLAILIIFLILFAFANDIYEFVAQPLNAVLPEGSPGMIATGVASPFFAPFKLTIFVAFFISMPYVLHQGWAFIAPGLYKNEIRVAMPILVSSIILFYVGIAFAYFVVFELIFGFFTSIGPESITIATDIDSYLNFVLKLFFAFGLAFEIPIATLLLIFSGVTTPQKLGEKRPYIVVGCFVFGMLLTPPDPFTQSMLAIPMWLLFEAGIIAGKILHKPDEDEREEQDKAEAEEEQDKTKSEE
ncbi:MAG: twin-arginine translocase subunit TatC [Pseudohongiellaceae bacterium]